MFDVRPFSIVILMPAGIGSIHLEPHLGCLLQLVRRQRETPSPIELVARLISLRSTILRPSDADIKISELYRLSLP